MLDAVTLSVPRGEIFGLVGANGAGKTTLLKILSTVLLPDRGGVMVDGIDALAHPAQVRRKLAVVPADERALFWRISATETVLTASTKENNDASSLFERWFASLCASLSASNSAYARCSPAVGGIRDASAIRI